MILAGKQVLMTAAKHGEFTSEELIAAVYRAMRAADESPQDHGTYCNGP